MCEMIRMRVMFVMQQQYEHTHVCNIYIYIYLFIYLYVYIEREILQVLLLCGERGYTQTVYIYSFTGLSIFHDVVIDAAFDY